MQHVLVSGGAGRGADRLLLAALWQHLAAAPQHSGTRNFAAVAALQQPAWDLPSDQITDIGGLSSPHVRSGSNGHTQDSSSHAAQQRSCSQQQQQQQQQHAHSLLPQLLHHHQQQQQQPEDQQLQRWRDLAQLSAHDARDLLQQHASLQTFLQHSSNLQSTYFANLACLSLHPADLDPHQRSQLQGVLALLPPRLLQQLLRQDPRVQQLLQRQQRQHCHLSQLQDWLLHSLQQQQQQQQPAGAQPTQPLRHHPGSDLGMLQQTQGPWGAALCSHQRFLKLAEAVVTALGLPMDSQPANAQELRLLHRAARLPDCSSSNSRSSSGGSPRSSSGGSPSSSSGASSPRAFSTSAAALTFPQGLALALETTAKAGHLRRKPLHDAAAAAELARQLHQAYGSDHSKVLRLLLSRPAMLWQHKSPALPAQVLADLQRLLPGLAEGEGLQLVVQQPRLLGCGSAQLQAVVGMLGARLQLNQSQIAQLVLQHPQVLVQPVQQMVPNIGFLVGVGLSPTDLQGMAVGNPKWLTSPLRELMAQWQFLQQVLKLGCKQDVVVFPQLLTLPIKSRLGPRVLYARKRNIKLLAPRSAAGPHAGPTKAWKQHRMVPLNTWLSVSDRQMCALMDLDLEDYQRFKQAWGRVEGVNWHRGC